MDKAIITPWTPWNEAEIHELKRLARSKTLFKREIAERMGKTTTQVMHMLRRLGMTYRPNGRLGVWNRKHVHLREPLLRYYLTHSAEECQERFGLTASEFKSCLTYSYHDPKLRHIRKETRRHDSWSVDEKLFLIRHAGIQPRKWIARKLKRGGVDSIKAELTRLKMRSKFTHGLPRKYLIPILGEDCPEGIKTQAGPTGGGRGDFHFIVIPWVQCERLLRTCPRRFTPELRAAILAMATFQRWIFQTKCDRVIVRKLKEAAHAK